MKNKILNKIMILILIMLFITVYTNYTLAITPSDIDGSVSGDTELDVDFVDKVSEMLRTIGIFIAVGAMMMIGIKYITGSVEEKASYKKTMVPYLTGCVLLFGASIIAPEIIKTFKSTTNVEDTGNVILGAIQAIGTFIAVGVLMILGTKYMVGSAEDRASYRKTMTPFVVGSVLLFAAVNLTAFVYDIAKLGLSEGEYSAQEYIDNGHTIGEMRNELNRAKAELEKAKELENTEKITYWNDYIEILEKHLSQFSGGSGGAGIEIGPPSYDQKFDDDQ